MLFQKGKPKTGGRKKGTSNKSTLRFRDRLEAHGVDLEEELSKAIKAGNIELIKALQSLLPYTAPRFKDIETPQDTDEEATERTSNERSTADLVSLVKS